MKVRIKSGECPSYLTVGKVYEAYINKEIMGDAFIIELDNGSLMKGYFNNCPRLNGGSWEIVDDKNPYQTDRDIDFDEEVF